MITGTPVLCEISLAFRIFRCQRRLTAFQFLSRVVNTILNEKHEEIHFFLQLFFVCLLNVIYKEHSRNTGKF